MNHFFQRIVPALQNFYDISDSLIWHLYICCVGDPILKFKLGQ